jgi:chromosome partitioning protein
MGGIVAKVVTVMNMKGGVGKTTVTMHLAGILGRWQAFGYKTLKVLAIDYDPQFNLSQALLPPKDYFSIEKQKKTVLSVLVENDDDLDPFKIQVPGNLNPPSVNHLSTSIYKGGKNGGKLDLVASTLDLMYVALGEANLNVKPIEERFAKFIDEVRGLYDIILIDCHPAGSIFTQTSLRHSDHVVIPVVPQRYSVRGIGLMLEFIGAKSVGKQPAKPHILFNNVPRIGVSSEESTIRADKKFSAHCMTNTLKKFKAFTEPEAGKNFVWASGKPYSTEALGNLLRVSRELVTRIGG